MKFLLAVSRAIDAANAAIGKGISWLLLAAIFISAINAAMRKAFSMSSNAWLESQWYLFSAVFLIAAAYIPGPRAFGGYSLTSPLSIA
ncbi:permease component of C4 dicarboxylate transporter [Agrobacterium tumefaciens str. Cherry 2E-2-2]|jgi:TRAP-type mannitol/chloroaromatic compound transport system permease small subunit|nr:permease component of C4 dicarboxylate transporter [Agrobacterium tumefaciens str. Cherry 2E-2-2]